MQPTATAQAVDTSHGESEPSTTTAADEPCSARSGDAGSCGGDRSAHQSATAGRPLDSACPDFVLSILDRKLYQALHEVHFDTPVMRLSNTGVYKFGNEMLLVRLGADGELMASRDNGMTCEPIRSVLAGHLAASTPARRPRPLSVPNSRGRGCDPGSWDQRTGSFVPTGHRSPVATSSPAAGAVLTTSAAVAVAMGGVATPAATAGPPCRHRPAQAEAMR